MLSTWELAVEEIVSSGPDRIIVYEGAEEKLKQLGTGLLEKLGIGGPSWEQEERERYRLNMVPVENQLAAGQPAAEPQQQRRIQPATSRRVEFEPDYDYVEVEERRQREPLRQRRYLDEEEERGSDRLRDEVPSYGRDPERNDRPEAYGREPAYLEAEPREPAYREPQRREPQRRDPDDRSTDYRDDGSRQPEPLGGNPPTASRPIGIPRRPTASRSQLPGPPTSPAPPATQPAR